MPKSDAIPERIVLAAIRRAQLHSVHPGGVSITAVKDHLDLPHNAWTTRQVRPLLEALIASGAVEPGRRQSHDVYAITAAGRRRAASFRALPESPQHQHWRRARALASQELARIRSGVLDGAEQASDLIEAGGESSEPWLVLSRQLQRACWTMASALHCLHEWPESDDRRADRPSPRIAALRNTVLWTD
jgi:DNA-binding PadR family transcriptional regulator